MNDDQQTLQRKLNLDVLVQSDFLFMYNPDCFCKYLHIKSYTQKLFVFVVVEHSQHKNAHKYEGKYFKQPNIRSYSKLTIRDEMFLLF